MAYKYNAMCLLEAYARDCVLSERLRKMYKAYWLKGQYYGKEWSPQTGHQRSITKNKWKEKTHKLDRPLFR